MIKKLAALIGLLVCIVLALVAYAAPNPPPQLGRAQFLPTGASTPRAMTATDSASLGGTYIVNDPNGLPAPVGGVITLPTGIYMQSRALNIGANKLYVPAGRGVRWVSHYGLLQGSASEIFLIEGAFELQTTNLVNLVGNGIRINNPTAIVSGTAFATTTPSGIGIDANSVGSLGTNRALLQSAVIGARINSATNLALNAIVTNSAVAARFIGPTSYGILTIFSSSTVPGATHIKVDSTASFTGFSLVPGSVLVCGPGQTGINSDPNAFIVQGMNLTGVQFSGAGTYLTGVTANSSKARFVGNGGIENSSPGGFQTITAGATPTTLTTAGTYYKLNGTTTNVASQLFTQSNGRYTNAAGRTLTCDVVAQADGATSSPSGDYRLAIYKNGLTIQNPPAYGRATSSSLSTITVRTRVQLADGDYVEPWITNSGASGITITWNNGSLSVAGCN